MSFSFNKQSIFNLLSIWLKTWQQQEKRNDWSGVNKHVDHIRVNYTRGCYFWLWSWRMFYLKCATRDICSHFFLFLATSNFARGILKCNSLVHILMILSRKVLFYDSIARSFHPINVEMLWKCRQDLLNFYCIWFY